MSQCLSSTPNTWDHDIPWHTMTTYDMFFVAKMRWRLGAWSAAVQSPNFCERGNRQKEPTRPTTRWPNGRPWHALGTQSLSQGLGFFFRHMTTSLKKHLWTSFLSYPHCSIQVGMKNIACQSLSDRTPPFRNDRCVNLCSVFNWSPGTKSHGYQLVGHRNFRPTDSLAPGPAEEGKRHLERVIQMALVWKLRILRCIPSYIHDILEILLCTCISIFINMCTSGSHPFFLGCVFHCYSVHWVQISKDRWPYTEAVGEPRVDWKLMEVYLLNMVIFHGYVINNQMVYIIIYKYLGKL